LKGESSVKNSNSRPAMSNHLTGVSRIIAALAVALASLAVPLRAGVITGSFDGVSTLTPTDMPGVFTQNFSGDGSDMTFGSFTAASQSLIDFSNPPDILISNAKLSEIFAGGTLLGTGSGSGTASGHGTATITIDYVVTGGTGIFAGAEGEVTVTAMLTQTSATTEAVSASYTGSLTTVPEPSTLALLVTGLAGFVLRRSLQADRSQQLAKSGIGAQAVETRLHS
jgi:PEP-CTERM motif